MSIVKFGIQLPAWYERRLRLWAHYKGTNRATLAANILQARIEANWAEVDKGLDDVAQSLGISREELEANWLGESEE